MFVNSFVKPPSDLPLRRLSSRGPDITIYRINLLEKTNHTTPFDF